MKSSGLRSLDKLRLRLQSVSKRAQLEDELDEELRFHFDQVCEARIANGISPGEARRLTRIEFGGTEAIKEECRQMRGVTLWEDFVKDIGYAWRAMRKNPAFAFSAVGAIAMGVGVNTALFTLVYALLFRPLPVADPDTIRNVYITTRGTGNRSHYGTQYFISFVEYQYLRAHSRTSELAGAAISEMGWKEQPGLLLDVQMISDNLLQTTGVQPLRGRFFTSGETSTPGSSPVVILSYDTWQNYFGGAEDVIGRTMTLNRTLFTIVGVAPQGANGPLLLKPHIWVPLTMQALTRPGEPLITDSNAGWIQVIGRRRPGYSDGEMRSELEVLGQQSLADHAPGRTAEVYIWPGAFLNYPMIFRDGVPLFIVLFLAVSLVLVVSCANVANMLLARGLARRKEIAVRLAIGAGRGRLLRQMLTESLLLALLGSAAGLILAQFAGHGLVSMLPPDDIGQHQLNLSPDVRVLLYTLLVAVVTGLVFGLVPALRSLRVDLTPSLKADGANTRSRPRRFLLQNGLITVQVAVSLVLLVNAGLLLRGIGRAFTLDLGQSAHNIAIGAFDLRQQQFTPEQAVRFVAALRQEAAMSPGVESASYTVFEPMRNSCGTTASVAGESGQPSAVVRVACDEIGGSFFDTLRIPLLQGRALTEADTRSVAKVVVIDEDLARRFFGSKSPLGHRLSLSGEQQGSEIVGVVGRTTGLTVGGISKEPKVYSPIRGLRYIESVMVVRYAGDIDAVRKSLQASAARLDPNVTVRVKKIEENIDRSLAPARMAATSASALGGLALILACTGVYGVVAFAVGRRLKEVGIRMALGAASPDILRLLLWQGMKPVIAGALIGIALAAAAAQLIRAMLFGLSPVDPVAFGSMALLLMAVSVIAVWLPSSAAMRVDPANTLRHE